jgi:heptaprenyl diphosphate synthase
VPSETIYPGLDAIPEVSEALGRVEEKIVEATRVPDAAHSEITAYLASAGGKRVRPLLVLLGARLGGPIADPAIDAAVAVELIHVGSLHHDDVIDESPTRRGRSSVNANWGNSVAILAGDLVLARASEIGARLGKRASEMLARTLGTIVYGQMLELSRAYDLGADVDGYLQVIENKTASLISTSIALGGLVAGLGESEVEALEEYGRRMGIVFQIADDILDVVGTSERLGKPVGLDMIEGTYTLPLIYALEGPDSERLARLLMQIKTAKESLGLLDDDGGVPRRYRVPDEIREAVSEACEVVLGSGAISKALEFARMELEQATEKLAIFGDSPVVEVLSGVGDYILARLPLATLN